MSESKAISKGEGRTAWKSDATWWSWLKLNAAFVGFAVGLVAIHPGLLVVVVCGLYIALVAFDDLEDERERKEAPPVPNRREG
jgi:hypothetical protein